MAEDDLPPMPLRTRMIDASGLATQHWIAWFQQIFFRVGGHIALTNIELENSIFTDDSVTEDMLTDGIVGLEKLKTQIRKVTGTRGVPTEIVAAISITHAGFWDEIQFVTGSGGAVSMSADPQIEAGTSTGQTLTLVGGTNAVTIANGTGVRQNGSMTLDDGDTITYLWDGTDWTEIARKDAA